MSNALQKIKDNWEKDPNRGVKGSENKVITFDNLAQSIISTGPFYFYVIDFETMEMSYVKNSITDLVGHDPEKVTFDDILHSFHPDDMDFVAKAERFAALFYHKNIKPERLMHYKSSFNFRIRLKDGSYGLFNHQALMLTLGKNGGYGKCLNIHTHIDHLTTQNNYRYSLISTDNGPSYLNMKIDDQANIATRFSRKEIQILKLISEGLDNNAIADKLFVSHHTVKTHRKNILQKSEFKNMTELVTNSIIQGLI